jgi:large subunit ribosomal protein L18
MINKSILKTIKRERRHKRIRAKVSGTVERPRLSVFKSNKFIYAQIIDDVSMITLASASSEKAKGKTAILRAAETGVLIAKAALAKKIEAVVFDRGGYVYTGKVKALADGAREGGLKF